MQERLSVHRTGYLWALATTAICTAAAFAMYPYFELANIVMAYVLGSTVAAVRFGRWPAIVAAVANVLAFDFCFVPPRFTFSVAEAQYIITFAVMLIVTVVIASLMASVREADAARADAERERLRNTLLASISHDLRTPLAVIAGAGSTLADHGRDIDEASRVGLARSIETTAREMSDLVSNVLDLMRFEAGQIRLRRDSESVDDLVGSAWSRVETRMREHPVEVEIPADLPSIYVDASLIVQVLTNLLDNAAKYTPAGTRVTIAARPRGEFIAITVDDEGPGLSKAEGDRVFNKFQRGQSEGTVVGVGLGLAICRAIVRAHGGEIQAGENPKGGARFEFTVPTGEPTA
jgi:two-component system sensor histidine kinase KdpD